MQFFRKTLILIHRYLGILLCIPFFVWFVSGIFMIYAREMPTLTPEARLKQLPAIDAGAMTLSPLEAALKADLPGPPYQATLLTILGRPAYRFMAGGPPVTVFADTGEILEVNAATAADIARLFMALPAERIHSEGILTEIDQWTIPQARFRPFHKFTVDDDAGTELYISEFSGEVTVMTTRGSRALAWVAAIPHWFYFTALRTKQQAWRNVILWTSGLGIISAAIGLVLGIIQYRRRPPHIPYAGWMRWHYITGIIFGVFTLTWVFSGFLSVEPWFWVSDRGIDPGAMQANLTGGELDLNRYSSPPRESDMAAAKEVEFLTIQGDPYYKIQTEAPTPVLIAAESLEVRKEPFSVESLMQRITEAQPETKVLESTLLQDYDSYYYSFNRRSPLPVLRVKFDDPDSTWVYVDPRMSEVVGRMHRRERLQRWIYRGFHSLDFSFWYYNRPLWDIGVIVLSLGGVVLSFIGILISWKRLTRPLFRKTAR
jgi:uncharacterized iron-regulated membrane protein